jgi:hypothetical protein
MPAASWPIRLRFRDFAQISYGGQAAPRQEQVLEQDPAGMFECAPRSRHDDAKYRLRPEHSAKEMVRRDNQCCGDKHAPVAIESQQSQ